MISAACRALHATARHARPVRGAILFTACALLCLFLVGGTGCGLGGERDAGWRGPQPEGTPISVELTQVPPGAVRLRPVDTPAPVITAAPGVSTHGAGGALPPPRRTLFPHTPGASPAASAEARNGHPTPGSGGAGAVAAIEVPAGGSLNLAGAARGVARKYGGRAVRAERPYGVTTLRVEIYDPAGARVVVEISPDDGQINTVEYLDGYPSDLAAAFRARLTLDRAIDRAAAAVSVDPGDRERFAPHLAALETDPTYRPRYRVYLGGGVQVLVDAATGEATVAGGGAPK
ncbi:MAG: hypothetical protein HYV63_32240 [Candidatus Schekmanbacteria bacterium]|nr:hypothetical protein [Candidatus Schekmanbacteria bacterium]